MARDHRRLAAIVLLDVVGYSRLMGQDESGTLAALKAHRRELIDPKIAEHDGRIVKGTGDGWLLEFPSVVDAVRCSVEVQRDMAARNAGITRDQRLDFRIGINVGDIIIDGDDIFGDGVNVAARLEALADPGGICVSRAVRDQVLNKLSFTFEDLGAQQVKNIASPVQVYRVELGRGVPQAQGASRQSRWRLPLGSLWRKLTAGLLFVGLAGIVLWALPWFWKATPAANPPVLSVAVLPLTAPSNDTDASRFAEALTRYLMTGLPIKRQFGRVVVVPAGSSGSLGNDALDARELGHRYSVRYVLEGDVSRGGGDAKTANLRLVDAATGAQVWSGRESLQDADVASESSAALRKLAGTLQTVLIAAEEKRVKAQPASALTAPELVLRAYALGGEHPSLAGTVGAGKLVDEALRIEPDLVPALVLRAALIRDESRVDLSADPDRVAREQDRYTARAVHLDPTDPAAWGWRAQALASLGRLSAALEANATAIKLDPYEVDWYSDRAELMIRLGRPTEASALLDRAHALRPDDSYTFQVACEANLLAGHAEQAIAACEKASGRSNWWWVHLDLAAAYSNHGDLTKAAAAVAEVLRVAPNLTIAKLHALDRADNPEYLAVRERYFFEGLRKAGLPER